MLRIPDVYPGSRIPGLWSWLLSIPEIWSLIPDPTTATKEEGGGGNLLAYLLCRHKYHIIVNYFFCWKIIEKFWANSLFTQFIVTNLSKLWVWDPEFGKKPLPDPGATGQKRRRIRIRNIAGKVKSKSLAYAKLWQIITFRRNLLRWRICWLCWLLGVLQSPGPPDSFCTIDSHENILVFLSIFAGQLAKDQPATHTNRIMLKVAIIYLELTKKHKKKLRNFGF